MKEKEAKQIIDDVNHNRMKFDDLPEESQEEILSAVGKMLDKMIFRNRLKMAFWIFMAILFSVIFIASLNDLINMIANL